MYVVCVAIAADVSVKHSCQQCGYLSVTSARAVERHTRPYGTLGNFE